MSGSGAAARLPVADAGARSPRDGGLPARHVFVDFDGTIALEDSTDLLLERFADPAWREVEARYEAGLIGSRQCLEEQIALLRIDPAALDAFAAGIEIDPAFPAFLAACRRLDLPVTVVSDGLDRVIRAVLHRHSLDLPVVANTLEHAGGDRWVLSFPQARPECASGAGHCKCATIETRRRGAVAASVHGGATDGHTPGTTRPEVILIGDGTSDRCAAAAVADRVFARAGLADWCAEHGVAHDAFGRFGDLTPLL